MNCLVTNPRAKIPLLSNDDDNHSEEITSSPDHLLAQCLSAMVLDVATIAPSLAVSDLIAVPEVHLANQQVCFQEQCDSSVIP